MSREKCYITEATLFLNEKTEYQLVNFILLYLAAFAAKYISIEEWKKPEPDVQHLKQELRQKISIDLYEKLLLEDSDFLRTIDWLKKNTPIETKEDILGEIYLIFSKEKRRKQMGEHYTRTDLVSFIMDTCEEMQYLNLKILDPACGSGNFLIEILSRALEREDKEVVTERLYAGDFICGVDIQMTPCIITSVRILLELIRNHVGLKSDKSLPIYCADSLKTAVEVVQDNEYDLVVTNPPYLRYQSIPEEDRDFYRLKYESATGHFDLYTLFIEKSIKLAKDKGKIIILTSDKFMAASYGRGIRQYVSDYARLDQIFDLSQIFAFDAAVLAAVYFFTKGEQKNTLPGLSEIRQVGDLFAIHPIGNVRMESKWRYSSFETNRVLEKIMNTPGRYFLKDLDCRVSIGIQTTADTVFCRMIDSPDFFGIEEELIHPLVRGKDLKKWRQPGYTSQILYPYKFDGHTTQRINLEEYPIAKEYLETHKRQLEKRYYNANEWYEPLSPKSFEVMKKIKILTPDLASNCNFSLDTQGYLCNGTTYFIQYSAERSIEDYKFLLAILNSSLTNFVHKNLNTVYLASKKYRFQTQYMNQYPIILSPAGSELYQQIITIVDVLLSSAEQEQNRQEYELDSLIFDLFGLDNDDRKVILTDL